MLTEIIIDNDHLIEVRVKSLLASQASLYAEAGIPGNYIDLEEGDKPFICRDRGCRRFGHNFKKRQRLERHLRAKEHQVCNQVSL